MMTKTEIKELVNECNPTRNIYTNLLEMAEELADLIIKLDEIPTYGLKMNFDQVKAITKMYKSQVFDAQTAQRRGVYGTDIGCAELCIKRSIEDAKNYLEQWKAQSEEYEANRGKSISEEEIQKLADELGVDPNSEEFQEWIKAVY